MPGNRTGGGKARGMRLEQGSPSVPRAPLQVPREPCTESHLFRKKTSRPTRTSNRRTPTTAPAMTPGEGGVGAVRAAAAFLLSESPRLRSEAGRRLRGQRRERRTSPCRPLIKPCPTALVPQLLPKSHQLLRGFPGGSAVRIRLPVQGTQLRSLVQEDSTGLGATKPVGHDYGACAPEPGGCDAWAHAPQLLKPTRPRACALQETPPQRETSAPQLERSPAPTTGEKPLQRPRPSTAKNE